MAEFERLLLNDVGRFNASQMPLDDLEHLLSTFRIDIPHTTVWHLAGVFASMQALTCIHHGIF